MLNLARNFYAAWSVTTLELPEATLAPIGESAGEQRKVDKLTKTFTFCKEIENVPMPGFTLYKADKKRWSSMDTTWLVIDPRGFLVRITADNLEKILMVTGITEGLIQEKCVWAREDSGVKMSLIPVSSEKYGLAEGNTELLENKVDKADISIGDIVLLQNGLKGKYWGTQSLYAPLHYKYNDPAICKPQVFLRRQVIEVKPGKFYFNTDAKMLKIEDKSKTPFTNEDAMNYLNAWIEKGAYFTQNEHIDYTRHTVDYSSVHGCIGFASNNAVAKPTITLDEITKPEAAELLKVAQRYGDGFQLLLEKADGTRHVIDFPYGKSSGLTSFCVEAVKPFTSGAHEIILARGRQAMFSNQKTPKHTLDNFVKFYKIVKNVKNVSYI